MTKPCIIERRMESATLCRPRSSPSRRNTVFRLSISGKEHAEAGGLVSYGPGLAAMWRQSAIKVAKVLKGVKPADLPVDGEVSRPHHPGLGAAKALGVTVPMIMQMTADDVI